MKAHSSNFGWQTGYFEKILLGSSVDTADVDIVLSNRPGTSVGTFMVKGTRGQNIAKNKSAFLCKNWLKTGENAVKKHENCGSYKAIEIGNWLTNFRRDLLPPSSGQPS